MEIAASVLDLVGRTPMVRLSRFGAGLACPIVAKLEATNPGGSVKDRAAVAMIDAAERDGLLQPGHVILERTSGNTGVGLAMVAAHRGYRCVCVMTTKAAPEKVALLRAYGAEVIVCQAGLPADDPASLPATTERLEQELGAFRPDQYSNPANPDAHEHTTGPEIWRQTEGTITHLVAGVGTGGTITGSARYLRSRRPDIEIVGADPEGSIYSGQQPTSYLVEGIGEDFWPATFDPSVVDRWEIVSDEESFAVARQVTRTEGLLVGGSCGTALAAARRVAAGAAPDALVVVVVPDSGRGYLSKVFDDGWLIDQGLGHLVDGSTRP